MVPGRGLRLPNGMKGEPQTMKKLLKNMVKRMMKTFTEAYDFYYKNTDM